MGDIFAAFRRQTVSHYKKFKLFLFQRLNESETEIIRLLKYCCDSVKFHLPGSVCFLRRAAGFSGENELTAVYIF